MKAAAKQPKAKKYRHRNDEKSSTKNQNKKNPQSKINSLTLDDLAFYKPGHFHNSPITI